MFMFAAVEVNNLYKSFGKKQVLCGINIEIKPNEIFGLIGPNGAGKTTTLRILATILQPDSGEVKIFDHDVVESPSSVRKIMTYLPEDAGAYKNLTGYEFLAFIASFYDNQKDILELGVELSQLGPALYERTATYSKGMLRRLLVARTLMVRPKLAILDEPTSGLDVINALEIRNVIKRFAKEGTTILLSSHNMLEVEYVCDRIALIHKGRIIETGTPHELKSRYNAENIEEVFMKCLH